MIVKYYHLRNEKNSPRVTRCILKDGNDIAIGTSLCGYSDFPNKKDGRSRAYGRAFAALEHKKSLFPIAREEAMEVLMDVKADELDYRGIPVSEFFRDFKGLYIESVDLLNELEKKILNPKKEL